MARYCEEDAKFSGVVEVDESYFGSRRVREKRGRGAVNKVPVFRVLKKEGKVFKKIVAGCSRKDLMPIIKGKILEGVDRKF